MIEKLTTADISSDFSPYSLLLLLLLIHPHLFTSHLRPAERL